MKIGITANRRGLNQLQYTFLHATLVAYRSAYLEEKPEFHHGACVGGDEEGVEIAKRLGYKIIAHPPKNDTFTMKCWSFNDEIREPKSYYKRNRNIVNEVDLLLAFPDQWSKGTIYTMDYAKKKGKKMKVCHPDGRGELSAANR